ncbi:TetR/AcrR family transcriptional regulator [Phenylobacterium sp.]|uniref:TetR/AcrR family transcriptional regulator n=1 Tax=Phenylobacterium sp. TaxID=1871053 RepID=UPI00286D2267|nr:TetR/AcrR family transcriptional regulator [Phenylobacterium sp.]
MPWADAEAGRRRGYHVGNLRIQLLDEARTLLREGGLAKLNLRALAGRAGIAAGSVYHHYASKNALLAGLAAEGFGELEAALSQAAETAPRGAPIRASALAYFGFARSQPGVYGLMFDPQILAEPEVSAARDRAFEVLKQVIGHAASQHDRSEEQVHKVALAVWACGHGAASMTLAGEEGAQTPLMEDVIQGLEVLFRRD